MARDCPNSRACYQCGSPDHVKSGCPQLKQGMAGNAGGIRGGRVEPARGRARVFQMTTEEAVEAPDVVAGTFLVNSVPARILFNSGANLSFVSPHFARLLHMTPRPLEGGFEVEVADDRKA